MRRRKPRIGSVLRVILLPLILGLACQLPVSPVEESVPVAPSKPLYQESRGEIPLQTADQGAALRAQALPFNQEGLTHYLIEVTLDHEQGSFQGKATVDYANNEREELDRLYFRLYPNAGSVFGDGRLTVTQVSVQGSLVEASLKTLDTVLEVPLPHSLAPGEHIQLAFDFDGRVARDFGGSVANGYGIYNLSQGVLALAGWYPILATYDQEGWNLDPVMPIGDPVYSETALYTVDVTADRNLVVAATGVEVNRLEQDGTTTHRFASGPARDFFIVASPEFQKVESQKDNTTIKSLYLPGYEAAGKNALSMTQEALRIFNEIFGPYPYRELEVVQAPMNNAGGVEYPGVFLIQASLYADPEGLDFLFTVVHEVAHQWWYSTVGNDVIEEPWLDEALATFSSGLYFQDTRGKQFYELVVNRWQNTYENSLVATGRDQAVALSVGHFVGVDGGRDYGAVVYIKGALALHNLRQKIGDSAFFKALEDYYREFYFETASTSDLLGAFERSSGQELDGFYDQWFFARGSPPTEIPIPSKTPTATPEPTATSTPTPTTSPPVSFAVIGDYGTDEQPEEDVANLILSWGVDFIITTGDNNYPDGEEETIDDNIGRYYHSFIYPYRGSHGEGASTIRFFPALGNHDLLTDSGEPYFDFFDLPGNERYYDFVWGPVHLFALNSNDSEPDGVGLSSVQANWLREELAASPATWQVVYTHYAPYSSGYHGPTDWMQWPFEEWGADAVIAGHDHTYERLQINDIPYFVNGLGGGEIYNFPEVVEGSVVRYNQDYGAMLVKATSEQIVFQFRNRAGQEVDYYVINTLP